MAAVERVFLEGLQQGSEVVLTAGEEPDAYKYQFTIVEPGEMPLCELLQTNPDGSIVGPGHAILEGTGNWTTVQQNPLQEADWFIGQPRQDIAMSIGYGILYIGGIIIIRQPEDYSGERWRLEPPVTAIEVG